MFRKPTTSAVSAALAVLLVFTASSGFAQEQSTDYVPKETMGALLFNTKSFKEMKGIEYFPHEIVSAYGKRDFGVDPATIADAKMIFAAGEDFPLSPPMVGVVVNVKENVELGGDDSKLVPAGQHKGKKIFFDETLAMYVFQPKPRVILMASEEGFIGMMADAKGTKTPFTKLLANSKLEKQFKLIVSVEQLKPAIARMVEEAPAPPPFGAFNKMHEQIQSLDLDISMAGAGFDAKLVINNYSEEDARKLNRALKQLITMGKAVAVGGFAAQIGNSDDPVDQASYEYVLRISDLIEKQLIPKQDGKKLTVTFKNEIATVGILTGLLLPAVQAAREAARRTQSANNLKQMGLSVHNYYDVRRRFPAQAITDKKGKPLLSWRVEVLPYIGHQELYEQFRKDEPWDSPHNIKLLDKMPMVYQNPNSVEVNKTNFLAITGKGTAFDGKEGKEFRDFKGGTSNAAMFVEADRFVPWTKPEDFEVDWDQPTRGLGGIRPGGFQVALADGSVRFISSAVDWEVLKGLYKIEEGTVLD